MESTRPETYSVINEKAKAILIKRYEGGMMTTTASEKVIAAADETGLSMEKIKKWIGNHNAKLKRKKTSTDCSPAEVPNLKRRKGERKLTGQNVHYSRLSKEGKLQGFESIAERNVFVSNQWHQLSPSERESCCEEARRKNEVAVEEITQCEKAELIKKHKKKLLVEITVLEQLGVESASILVDENNDLSYYGSRRGINCINSSSKIDSEFRKYFDVQEKERDYSYQDLQDLYNKAYAKAIGSRSARVPYLKGNFVIEGLPEGIEWRKQNGSIKKPCTYGQLQINKIMECKENVKFVIIEQTPVSDELVESSIYLPPSVLKLVEENIATRAINGGARIEESEVDVLVKLRDEEYHEVMSGYSWCFTQDALKMIRNENAGTIVATFTSSPKKFWLFHFEGNLQDLNSIDQSQSIPGYWLQKVKGQHYQVLTERAVIKNINIIKKANGEVMACCIPERDSTSKVLIDKKFTLNVKDRLKELNMD